MNTIIPIFRIFDIDKAREFYIDWLGFKIDWEHRFGENSPLYMSISKDEIIIHLSEHYGDATPGSKVMIHFKGLKEYCQILQSIDYRYYKPCIEESGWGSFIMELIDPFGNRLMFNEDKSEQR
ncbi:glyoxalase superfamily protein [Emticicia sp. BO119]|uniref:glyoxalase superfamily protein n=1 Tax=Emticicia sp. BO119 TaxID=2757768 RepID=UPI0015F050DA|nr:glyoxalase superfamily protein [Emticicia sp. BO119]MBA4849952.1 VOC family protein [Emticicia sp. BO119]